MLPFGRTVGGIQVGIRKSMSLHSHVLLHTEVTCLCCQALLNIFTNNVKYVTASWQIGWAEAGTKALSCTNTKGSRQANAPSSSDLPHTPINILEAREFASIFTDHIPNMHSCTSLFCFLLHYAHSVWGRLCELCSACLWPAVKRSICKGTERCIHPCLP